MKKEYEKFSKQELIYEIMKYKNGCHDLIKILKEKDLEIKELQENRHENIISNQLKKLKQSLMKTIKEYSSRIIMDEETLDYADNASYIYATKRSILSEIVGKIDLIIEVSDNCQNKGE